MGLKDPLLLARKMHPRFAQAKDRATMAPSDGSDSRDGTIFPPNAFTHEHYLIWIWNLPTLIPKGSTKTIKVKWLPPSSRTKLSGILRETLASSFFMHGSLPKASWSLRYIQSCYYDLLQQAPLVGVLQVWHSTHSCPGGLSSLCVSIARVVAALPSRLPMIFFHSIVRMTRSSSAWISLMRVQYNHCNKERKSRIATPTTRLQVCDFSCRRFWCIYFSLHPYEKSSSDRVVSRIMQWRRGGGLCIRASCPQESKTGFLHCWIDWNQGSLRRRDVSVTWLSCASSQCILFITSIWKEHY